MTKLITAAALAAAPIGASAARIFSGSGPGFPRIALKPEDGMGAAEFKQLADSVKAAHDKVKEVADKALDEAKKSGGMAEETKVKADEALSKLGEAKTALEARLTEIEQKISRPGGGGGSTETKSIGEMFVENEKVKSLLGDPSRRVSVSVSMEGKTINNLTTGTTLYGMGVSPSNSLIMADRQGMVSLPDRPMTVRDLITPGQTSSNSIEYPVETGFQNSAAMVAEGATKPKSDISFDLKSTSVRTLAHIMKASRQIMDDVLMLRSYIDGRLRYGLQYVEEGQILYGDGTGQNLMGIIPQATAYSAPFVVTGETAIDRIRLGILQASLALYPPSGSVLHPTDWARIEMVKDGMGRYLIGDPTGQIAPRLWNLPVVPSMALNVGTFLTGAFKMGAQIFDRMTIEVLLSTENVDDFERNMVTIRGEERIALAVYRPAAFITGNLPA